MLPVAVPAHTPLLAEASEGFGKRCSGAIARPGPVRCSAAERDRRCDVFDVQVGADKLARQIEQM